MRGTLNIFTLMKEFNATIIIPTLNEEKFIAPCIESIVNQSFPIEKMDIMVIDGGSIDKTKDIVEQYIKKYPNIRFINNPKQIQSVAFNIGVQNSSAPWIIRLDAHALYHPDYVKKCIEYLESDGSIGNVGGVWDIKPQNTSLQATANSIVNQVRFGIGGASFRVGAEAGEVDTVPFGAFPRKVIEEVGGMREDLPRGEDNEINSRIKKAGYKIFLDPSIVSTYFARPTILASVKQMYKNGLSIGWLINIDRSSIGLRHLIPILFSMSLMISLVVLIIVPSLWWIFIGILIVYSIAAFIASYLACRKFGFRYFFILPVIFFCIHSAYGLGTLIGIFYKN